MIKKGNNIRFGNAIFVVENIDENYYLLKNTKTNVINWVSKKQILENLEKINLTYKNILTESKKNEKMLSFKNDYLTIKVIEEGKEHSEINIITESEIYSKCYPYSGKRAVYEFEKFFKYTNELTPFKLCKVGFKKHRVN